MRLHFRFAALAVAVLGLLAAGGAGQADDKAKSATQTDHLDRLASRLNLNDQQKEAIHKIQADYDARVDPVEHRFWRLHREEYEAMKNLLTDTQRAKLPEAFKEMQGKEMMKFATELKLNDEQKQKIASICESFEPKFHELAAQKGQDEDLHKQFRELRHQMIREIRAQLKDDQRDKLPAVVREEHRYWRNPAMRNEHLKALGEKLGVTAEQKMQFRKILDEYDPKVMALHAEMKKLHQEEYTAIEKVLTEQQRTQWKDMHKGWLGGTRSE